MENNSGKPDTSNGEIPINPPISTEGSFTKEFILPLPQSTKKEDKNIIDEITLIYDPYIFDNNDEEKYYDLKENEKKIIQYIFLIQDL